MEPETNAQMAIGVIATCFSGLLYLTPLKYILPIYHARSTEGIPDLFPFQLLAILWNCAAWSMFGCVAPNAERLMIVNIFGFLVHLGYLWVVYHYDTNVAFTMFVGLGLFVGLFLTGVSALLVYAVLGTQYLKVAYTGIQCLIFCTAMNAFPMIGLGQVHRNRDYRMLPIWACAALFFNGGFWLIYACMVSNHYSMITNGIGGALGFLQILVHVTYRFLVTAPNQQNGAQGGIELSEE